MSGTFRRMDIMAGKKAWEEVWSSLPAEDRAEIEAAIREGRQVSKPNLAIVALGRIHNARSRWWTTWGLLGICVLVVVLIGVSILVRNFWPLLALPSVPLLILMTHFLTGSATINAEKVNMLVAERTRDDP